MVSFAANQSPLKRANVGISEAGGQCEWLRAQTLETRAESWLCLFCRLDYRKHSEEGLSHRGSESGAVLANTGMKHTARLALL